MAFTIYGYEQTNHRAEKRVFDAFLRCSCRIEKYFSFGVANWVRFGDEMESDLILVGKAGIFVVEVKGGMLDVREGAYYQNGKYMTVSPLKQASHNYWKLIKLMESNGLRKYKDIGGGYVCVFPETTWDYSADTANRSLILDFAFDQHLAQSMAKIINEYRERNAANGLYSGNLSSSTVDQIKSILVGNTRHVSDVRQTINMNTHKLIELSEEQYERYQEISENKHIIVKGPPGSGKTLLAYQIMKDAEQSGTPTLFLCKNKALAVHLRANIERELGHEPKYVTIKNIDQLAREYSAKSLVTNDFRQITASAVTNITNDSGFTKYGYLLLDEGQDLMRSEYIDLIDCLLAGGLAEGRWCMFIDFNQNLLNFSMPTSSDPDAKELYELYFEKHAAVKRLTKNYRNTDIIQRTASTLSNTPAVISSGLTGEAPRFEVFHSIEQEARAVSDDVNKLIEGGIKPSEITILSFVGKDRSVAGQKLLRLKNGIQIKHISDIDLSSPTSTDNIVTYASLYEYKGLDNDVILFTDINDIDKNRASSALHLVGATRARNHFIMYVTPEVMTRLLDPEQGNLLHAIDPAYTVLG